MNSNMPEKKSGYLKAVNNRVLWVLVLMKETFTEMPLNGKFKQSSKNSKEYREKRVLQRERRTELGFLTVSLAGYTNSGKSSLFNALTEDTVEVDNALFTTLSTTTRMIEFSNRKFLITDTVGFIDRLPISLIEAFHSTLEETIFSDLIIILLDLNEPLETIKKKNNVCLETIERLGACAIPTITALNKIDKLTEEESQLKLEELKDEVKNPILVSAKCQTNLDELRKQILRILENYQQAQFSVPLTGKAMPFISWVHGKTHIEKETFTNETVEVCFESTPSLVEQVRRKVEELNGKFQIIPPK